MEVVPNLKRGFSWSDGPKRLNTPGKEKKHSMLQQTSLLHLWRSGDFSDAIVVVEGVTYHVHRNILACTSDYFRALFTDTLHTSQCEKKETQTQSTKAETPLHLQARDKTTQATQNCFTTNKNLETVNSEKQAYPVYKSSPTHNKKSSSLRKSSNVVPKIPNIKPPRFQVTLCDVSPEVMSHILEHLYGGRVAITQENVEQILTAADRFQVTSLVHECCEFLSQQLSTYSCIPLIQLSSNFYECTALKQAASQFFLDNFETVYKTSPEFVYLTASELYGFLMDDSLNVRREENILDAVVRWVTADNETREDHIPSLVQCARVGSFLPGLMQDNMTLPNLCGQDANTACYHDVMDKVVKAVSKRQQELMIHSNFTMFNPRLPRDVMFVIGGSNYGSPLGIVEAFDSRTWNWLNIGAYDFAPRSYHGVAHIDKYIYIVGGFDGQSYLRSCCKFCPDTFIMGWESVTPMHTKRCYVGVTQFQGAIYAMGGYDGVYRLNSAERFDPGTNQWSFISPMTQHRSDAGVAVLDDKIYVCGGFSGSECIGTVEMYDPQLEEWIPQPAMPHGRSGLGVVSHADCLYAVGGFNGIDSSVRLSSMESYNPATRQWTTLSPMPHPRSNMAVAVMEDILYAIGGYNGERTSAVVECYDFENDSWHQATRLSQSRSALSVCVLSSLSNTASLLGRERNEEIEDTYDDSYY